MNSIHFKGVHQIYLSGSGSRTNQINRFNKQNNDQVLVPAQIVKKLT